MTDLNPSERELDVLKAAMATRDVEAIQAVLMHTVEGYRPDGDGATAHGTATRAAWSPSSQTLH